MTFSIIPRPGPPLDLLPSAARSWIFEKTLLATAQLVTLPIGNRQLGLLLGNAIPKIFHKLKTFSASKFEERCEFGIHDQKAIGSTFTTSTIRNIRADSILKKTLPFWMS